MDATAEGLQRVSEFLSTQGVTAWLPTFVPSSLEQYGRSIAAIADLMSTQPEHWDRGRPARKGREQGSSLGATASVDAEQVGRAGRPRHQYGSTGFGARVLGVHYEGPFVSGEQSGALHREYFKTFKSAADLDGLALLPDAGAIHMMTLAPEIEGGIELVRELNKRGWIVSLGHTRANTDVLDQAGAAGARHMTHFMNAMAPLHHRSPGPVGWGLMRDDVTCDLIADGIHLDRETLRLLQKLKTPDRLLLISDAICAAGLGDGDYQIWGETITVAEGRTSNASGTIAGSVITMLDAVRMMLSLGASEVEVARMAATNPARLVRIDKDCGSIEEGKRADLVALDHEHNVKLTIIGGQVAYSHNHHDSV
jgi:N-acetylglucosamine-6-phosphate deacetylase